MYVRPVAGEYQGLIRVLEGNLVKLTQRVPTLHIEHIPATMQELVVGIPPIWIHLMRQVVRAVLAYIDAVEAAAAEEAKEARAQGDQYDRGDQGGQAQTQEHFMDLDPCFVYFLYIIQL